MEVSPVMTARDLAIGYRNGKTVTTLHQDLSFDLWAGELTCLLGPNGGGKSTLLRTLSAFQSPLSGSLLLEGKPLDAFSEREKSRKIGVVLTDKTQVGGLTVYELVALGRQPHTGFWGRLDANDHRLVREAIEAVGISHKSTAYMCELSDGERQKVMIAKALVQECPLILLDEPTAFLDVTSRIEIMALLHDLAYRQQKTILLSTHDIEQALTLADRLWLLSPGQGLRCGVTEDLIFEDALDRLFDREKVRFDRTNGGYYPPAKGRKMIVVKSADPTLRHWMVNVLNRRHYWCLSDVPADSDYPLLTGYSPQDMTLNAGGQLRRFSSFAGLVTALKASE